MISRSDIESAYNAINSDLYPTPMVYSSELSKISGARVFLKMEHLQHTGSFKLRGILNKIRTIDRDEFNRPFVTASTGNHAAAFAYASEIYGFKGVLFLPEGASEAKIKAIEHSPVQKIFFGKSSMEAELKAAGYAKEINGVFIHPYNDIHIITGQGTIGVEIKAQCPEVDTVLAPVGGGGLVSGISSYFIKTEGVEVIGCQPENAAEMYESVQLGSIVSPSLKYTISDATAGGIDDNAITFDICRDQLSGFEISSEEEIKKAVAFIVKYHHTIIEPASALPVAALLRSKNYSGKSVVLVLTGKKTDISLLTEILSSYGNYY